MGKSQQYGVQAYKSLQITSGFTLDASMSLYGRVDDTKYLGDDFHKSSFQYYADIVLRFMPTKEMNIEVFANYNSDTHVLATKTRWLSYSHLRIGHYLFKRKGYISLKVNDPLNFLTKVTKTTRYKNMNYKHSYRPDNRAFTLAFSYNFGSDKIKGKRNRQTGTEGAQGRV